MFMSMAPTSPFILFEEKLMEVIKKTPKTSPLEIYILKIYLEMKTETDIVQEVGTKYDSPPLDEKDSCGQNSRKRKEKNRLYTWIKNFITRKTCAPVESFKEKWTRFADANPSVVMQYVISRPRVIEQLQCILDSDSEKELEIDREEDRNTQMEGVEAEEDFEREQFIDSEENIINEEEDLPTMETPISYPKRKRIPRKIYTPSSSKVAEKQENKKKIYRRIFHFMTQFHAYQSLSFTTKCDAKKLMRETSGAE
ncbi:uncharacterized protein LOC143083425 isoform X2 [Mytilus galloprovincialis]|uniref:uncharacterized protein LOC143059871 isoform X2 n=1 Tax=Mytilus galloprovincialis TaxID=29158 RepID=UPI003F7C9FDC